MTISVQGGGGHYAVGNMVGITQRYVGDAPADASPYVASSDIQKLIIYYTDYHDVDEDVMSMARHSGRWSDDISAGIMRRYIKEIPSEDVSHVASSNMKNSHIIRIFIMSTKI